MRVLVGIVTRVALRGGLVTSPDLLRPRTRRAPDLPATSRRPHLAVVILTLLLVAGACSAGAPAATPGGSAAGGTAGGLSSPATGAGGGTGGALPCDKLAPTVTAITGLPVASIDAKATDCSFSVSPPGDSSSSGMAGIVDIRQDSTRRELFDTVIRALTGTDGVDVAGIGDRARMTKDGSLLYAVHNGRVYAVQQVLLFGGGSDLGGNAKKLMSALFQLVQ